MSAAQSDAVPPGEGRVRAAVQGLCGSGLQRGPLPVPQPVPGHRHQGDVPAHRGRRLQVQQLPGVCVCGWVDGSVLCSCVCFILSGVFVCVCVCLCLCVCVSVFVCVWGCECYIACVFVAVLMG